MPAIPESVLRKLYVPDSLKPMNGGFSFTLRNTFAPMTLTGLTITSNELTYDAGNIYLSFPDEGEIPAGGLSGEKPINLAVNSNMQILVFGAIPRNQLVIRVETCEAGVLQFGVAVTMQDQKTGKKKKTNLLNRINHRIQYANQVFRVQQDPQHPAYHFAPPANWMNDPNGLIYWKGNYHLFYQYNPFEPTWGNIHWGHAISKDMLHWKHAPISLWPDPKGADAAGCFSGSIVDNNGTPTVIYTGVYPEVQCLATSPMDDLQVWQKRSQPVISSPPQGMQLEGFRDPCVWQESGEWRMILGSGLTDVGGAVLLYRSKDLLDWQYMGMLFHGNAKSKDPLYTGTMWECPSFFPMDNKWVLIVSVCAPEGPLYSIYFTGQYLVDRFIPDGPPRLLDGGAGSCYYASQTSLTKTGKRVVFGWLREARSAASQLSAGWSGAMSLPRYLSFSDRGELCCNPPGEIQSLRGEHELLIKPNQISSAVLGSCLEILIRIPPDTEKWCGVHLTAGQTPMESALIGCDSANSAVVVDCRKAGGVISAMPVKLTGLEDLILHVFVDGSIIEVYVEDAFPISGRYYMAKPQALRVQRVGEASVELWKIRI